MHIDGGLHATEVAGPQHTPLLAYDLLRKANEPATKAMLDNVVLMLWPTINPDGQQMVAEWYMKNVGTPYELSGLPQLYQEYVGHDNNRDAYMLNMIESRAIEHTWRQWEPQIVYVHHQVGPFPTRIWLPPFSEPVGIEAPAVIAREINMIGMAMAKALDENGQPGATHMGRAFDAWYPGYIDYAPIFKNIAAYWTETALYLVRHAARIHDQRLSAEHARPPPAESLLESVEAGLVAAARRGRLHGNRLAGDDRVRVEVQGLAPDESLSRGEGADCASARPSRRYAYVVPQDQRDPVAAVELLRRLAFGGVRVSQLTDTVTIDGVSYPAGTWIVPTDQEFAAMAREVLDVQRYPDLRQYPGGPPERPYDAAGWTLPLQMGVRIAAAATPLAADVRAKMKLLGPAPDLKVKPTPYSATPQDAAPFDSVPGAGFDTHPGAAAIVPPAGRITGAGMSLALDPAQNNSYRAINRAWASGAAVHFSNGRYVISGLTEPQQDELVKALALVAERSAAGGKPVAKPRIGLFRPWSGSMDEGWTRWLLEQYGFEYVTLRPADFKTPLTGKVDAVILADDARLPIEGAAAGGRGGRGGAGGPGREVRPEYADRLSPADLAPFEQFVRGGGTLVCVNSATTFAIQQFKLPVKNAVAGLRSDDFFMHGTIVEVTVDRAHQVMAGLAEKTAVFADSSPVFETREGFKGQVLARYQDAGSPLLSGYLIGEKYLNGKAAALDVEVDRGRIILLGFRPGLARAAIRDVQGAVQRGPRREHGRAALNRVRER